MKDSVIGRHESIDETITEDIYQLTNIGFGEGAATCHVCNEMLEEGDPVVAYAVRPVSASTFDVGSIFCQEHDEHADGSWSRSGRELIVRGRVGMISDTANQESWPVLLDPEPKFVSPIGSLELYTPDELKEMPSRRVAGSGGSATDCDPSSDKNELQEPVKEARPIAEQLAKDTDAGDDVMNEDDAADSPGDDSSGGGAA